MKNTKVVYKCFKVVKSCETCKFIECEDVMANEICESGTCSRIGEKVDLKSDCEKWDFDENLFDDTFWIVKPNITGGVL